jgi:hypothetical protein
MNFKRFLPSAPILRNGAAVVLVAALAACSGSKLKPAELGANPALMGAAKGIKIPASSFRCP